MMNWLMRLVIPDDLDVFPFHDCSEILAWLLAKRAKELGANLLDLFAS